MPPIDEPSLVDNKIRNTSVDTESLDDPRFRIRPLQQVASACTGALITACFSKKRIPLYIAYD